MLAEKVNLKSEPINTLFEIPSISAENRKHRITHYSCIYFLTWNCNLRCNYCYEKDKNNQFMSEQVARDGIDFFMDYADRLHIQFFGGEPLLQFPLMKKINAYLSEIYPNRFSFSIFTNGVLIDDEVKGFFDENKVSVVLSIDGPKHVQDLNRVYPNGKGTFDTIYPMLLSLDKKHTRIRMTVTPNNVENMFESMMFFYELGYRDIQEEIDRFVKWSAEEIDLLINEYKKVADFLISKYRDGNFSWPNYERRIFPFVPPLNKWRGRCGSTEKMCSMDVNGDLYPCQKFIVNRTLKVGDVYSGFNNEHRKIVESYRLPDYLRETRGCKECSFVGICFAGCIADNMILDTDTKQDCLFRKVHYEMYEGLYKGISQYIDMPIQNINNVDQEFISQRGGCGGEYDTVCGGEGCGGEGNASCGGESCGEGGSCGSED